MAGVDITGGGGVPVALSQDIYINNAIQGQIDYQSAVNVNIVDTLGNPITPVSTSLVGNTDTVVMNIPNPNGVYFKFPQPSQYTSYVVKDTGWRFQNGFYNITQPTYPSVVAELDYSAGSASWFTLKTALKVNGVSSKSRFVDVNGVQTFSAVGNANLVVIDKLTGLMFTRNYNAGGVSWNTLTTNVLTYSLTINSVLYSNWYLIGMCDFLSIFGMGINLNTSIGFRDPSSLITLAFFGGNTTTSDTDGQASTQSQAVFINNIGLNFGVSNKANAINNQVVLITDARNLISA